jgi:cell division protein FtsI (penicillin-binding protein 3)
MTRAPLRPLAPVLEARARGENPDRIERAARRQRHEEMRDRQRQRAESRLITLAVMFCLLFFAVGYRMASLAGSQTIEIDRAGGDSGIVAQRADIVDRNGAILATNLITHALYAQPHLMVDPARAARELAAIFPDMEEERLHSRFTSDRKFLWLRRHLSPEQRQAVHEIGEPGLRFGPREMRLYPNGPLAAHILGGAGFGREGVAAAEIVGRAGVEKTFDAYLRDPARGGQPLALSIDLSVQAAMREVLENGMRIMDASGAAAVLMDVRTGEILSMVSLPDFDPNDRPALPSDADASENPLFNRAVQGLYELGSTFKVFTAAMALEEGLVNPDTIVDIRGPLRWGRHKIEDFHDLGQEMSVTGIVVESSNIGTARLAQAIGAERQQGYLDALGLLDPTGIELLEAGARPLYPRRWSELSTMTISYGHGLSASIVHLAAGYATIANGGHQVAPTLLRRNRPPPLGPSVISERTADQVLRMLRQVVTEGTASFGEVAGYAVGGKTGTADKPRPGGGYYEDRVIATFAAVFPVNEPRYVLVTMLDEPTVSALGEARRTAGWTAVPVAAEIIRRVGPLLGLRPATVEGESAATGGDPAGITRVAAER